MNNQFPFTKHEAALLLDFFLQYNETKKTRSEAIKECSSALRKMAINNGLSIDNSYRNEAGIGFQMASMESAFIGTTIVKPATQLFKETVRLYKEQPRQYETLLSEAKSMISGKEDIEKSFFDWFSKKEPFHRDIGRAVETIKQYAIRKRLAEDNIFDVFTCSLLNKIQIALLSDKLFVALYKMQMTQIKVALKNLIEFSAFLEAIQDEQKKEKTTVVDGDVPSEENNKDETNASSGSTNMACTWKDAFVKWLTESQHLSDSTCASLISAVRKTYQYGISQGLSLDGFYSDNVAVAQKKVSELLLYPEFIEFDNGQNHRYSLAVKKYSQYLQRSNANTDTEERKSESINQKRLSSESISSILKISETGKNNVVDQISSISKPDKKESDGIQLKESRYLREDKEAFYCWLRDDQHMAERTCHSYVSNVRSAERIAKEHNLSSVRLFTNDCNEAKATADALFADTAFVEYNRDQHNRFSAAIGKLLLFYGICFDFSERDKDLTDLEIVSKERAAIETMKPSDNVCNPETTKVCNNILSLVSAVFPNGIRPASIIDINKLKRSYLTRFNYEIPSDVDLVALLLNSGLKCGEKLYFLTETQKQSLIGLVKSIIESGYSILYYTELLSLHGEIFETCRIYDCLLMRTVFRSIMPEFTYKVDYMLIKRDADEVEEISRGFGGDVVLTCQQLKRRCPYLPMNAIKQVLSRSDKYVWSSPETYAQTDLIELDSREVSDVINHIIPLINTEGYFSLAQLHIEDSCGMNPLVSSNAVRDSVYIRYLANHFTRNGLIVKRPELNLTSYQLMETWLKGLDSVTLSDIEDYERELTGHYATLGISAACGVMVRINHDTFISDSSIQFEVDAVDHAINLFVRDRIIPITSITSFTSFPDVQGYSWNLYLVESFLRRFSKRFTIYGGPAQISYVGSVFSLDKHFSNYEDCLAHVIIQDGIMLTEDAIGRYLTEHKFILRRSEMVGKVLERARLICEHTR